MFKSNNGELYSKVVDITPEIAADILQTRNNKNRPINHPTVDYYAHQMKKGAWMLNGEGVQFSKEGELLNGQHRLLAVVKADMTIRMFLIFNIDKEAFATYDLQRTRTAADLFNMEGIKNANNLAAVTNRYIALTKQEGDAKTSQKKKMYTKHEQLMEYLNNRDLFDEVYEVVEKCYFKMALLTTTEYGAYMTFLIKDLKHDKEKVFSFFRQLVVLEQPEKHKSIGLLRDILFKDKAKPQKMTQTYRYAYVVKAWRAYIQNSDISFLAYDPLKEKSIPQFI